VPSSPEERMMSAAREARRSSVGAARLDDDCEGEAGAPAVSADEAALVAADDEEEASS
jgi:hypothetical protein